jgi:hypothetical protein
MYMRLAFSVAIHTKPEILLVDEVLAVGDGNFQRKCMERIAQLRRSGVTIVLVSHDLDTVARLCHQVVWLDKGHLRNIGEGRVIVNDYISFINEQQQAYLNEAVAAANNAQEESSASNGKVHPSAKLPEAYITGIQLVNQDGEVINTIKTGEDLIIRIRFQASKRIEFPNFGLALHRDDGIHVTGPNTQIDRYTIDAIEGSGYVDYTLPAHPLMSGRYYVSASIYDETHTFKYDYVHQVYSFVVQPHSVWDRLGVVRLSANWSYQLTNSNPAKKETGFETVEGSAHLAENSTVSVSSKPQR